MKKRFLETVELIDSYNLSSRLVQSCDRGVAAGSDKIRTRADDLAFDRNWYTAFKCLMRERQVYRSVS